MLALHTQADTVVPASNLTAYADLRNVLNIHNIVGVFAETGDVVNAKAKQLALSTEFTNLASEAAGAGALLPGGTIDLTGNCNSWQSVVNCVALRRVEQRFGDGDGRYTLAEQTRALDTYYNSFAGPQIFNGQPRHIRVGFEVNF